MVTAIKQTDPILVAIKAEILFGLPELTGKQINAAAMLALIAVNRFNEASKAAKPAPGPGTEGPGLVGSWLLAGENGPVFCG
jgi:hypothetical protein